MQKAAVDRARQIEEPCQHGKNLRSKVNKRLSSRHKVGTTVHFLKRSWTDATSKNVVLDNKFPTYRGRVVLHGDAVKSDSGSFVVFNEQGSSASHMTAGKVLDVTSRLPGCVGQASGAVSAYFSN